jgi:hypothetical protein
MIPIIEKKIFKGPLVTSDKNPDETIAETTVVTYLLGLPIFKCRRVIHDEFLPSLWKKRAADEVNVDNN